MSGEIPLWARDQLSAFRKQLDGEPRPPVKKIPGFLYRDGQEVRITQQSDPEGWAALDNNLLARHVETYKRGLEEHQRLLRRIRAVEILQGVRDDWWNKGELQQTPQAVTLKYKYLQAFPEYSYKEGTAGYTTYDWGVQVGGGGETYHQGSSAYNYTTGRWFTRNVEVHERISVNFGTMEYPDPNTQNLPGGESNQYKYYFDPNYPMHARHPNYPLSEFFMDWYIEYNPDSPNSISKNKHETRYLPNKIWTRPDNLVIRVTVPFSLVSKTEKYDYHGLPIFSYKNYGSAMLQNQPRDALFNQGSGKEVIVNYLNKILAAQKNSGDLPSQKEAIEREKIKMLKQRGLLKQA